MNAATANIINGLVLIAMGLWGYFSSSTPSMTALIPVGFGVVLLLLTPGVKSENKVIAHIAVLLTLLVLLMIAGMVLPKSITIGGMRLLRTIAMILSGVLAMVAFIRSFIAARKAREAANM